MKITRKAQQKATKLEGLKPGQTFRFVSVPSYIYMRTVVPRPLRKEDVIGSAYISVETGVLHYGNPDALVELVELECREV